MPYMLASTTYYTFFIRHGINPPKRFPEFLLTLKDDEIRQCVQQLSGPHGQTIMHAYAIKNGYINAKT